MTALFIRVLQVAGLLALIWGLEQLWQASMGAGPGWDGWLLGQAACGVVAALLLFASARCVRQLGRLFRRLEDMDIVLARQESLLRELEQRLPETGPRGPTSL